MIKELPSYVFVDDSSLRLIPRNNVLRSEMETGMPKTRPIQSGSLDNYSMQISFCKKNLLPFKAWFKSIKFGADWFIMTDPIDGVRKRFRFVETELEHVKRGSLYLTNIVLETYNGV